MFDTLEEARTFGRDVAHEVKDAINKRTTDLNSRIAQLEAKIVRLEAEIQQRNFSYAGVWREGKVYGVGSFVTHSGALWHSNIFHNTTRPGDGNVSCAVKSGRDGKDRASK
jgi:uncharacterized small protein (DUF1192 family)